MARGKPGTHASLSLSLSRTFAVSDILGGKGCKIFKRDLKRAFRQIPVDPNDIPLLGFQVDSEFYFHSVLPFGGRSCVMCCQRTTKAVVFILEQEEIFVDVYIDDFFGTEEANNADYAFERIK